MYAILSSNYKYPDSSVELVPDNKMRKFCIDEIIKFKDFFVVVVKKNEISDYIKLFEYVAKESITNKPHKLQDYKKYPLNKLIGYVLKLGNKMVDGQHGTGITNIIRGDNMVILDDPNRLINDDEDNEDNEDDNEDDEDDEDNEDDD